MHQVKAHLVFEWIKDDTLIGLIRVTGVTLPFLSYGGSSLLLNYMMVGILISISRSDEGC